MEISTFDDLYEHIRDEQAAIKYLIENNIVWKRRVCCGQRTELYDLKIVMCRRCSDKTSIFEKTFFFLKKKKTNDILLLIYLFITDTSPLFVLRYYGNRFNKNSITSYYKELRSLLSDRLYVNDTNRHESILITDASTKKPLKIGGKEIVVQLYEFKSTQEGDSQKDTTDTSWLLGGVDKTARKRLFIVTVPDQKKETLLDIITKFILPESLIYTNLWKGYRSLTELEDTNQVIGPKNKGEAEHNENIIEGTWNHMNLKIFPRKAKGDPSQSSLDEHIWRKYNANNLWSSFMKLM